MNVIQDPIVEPLLRAQSGDAMKRVIFACVHNAGRSQMAAAFFNAIAAPNLAHAISAGTRPADHVHPSVRDAMMELGFDLTNVSPQRLTDDLARGVALIVTMGCGDECPVVPGAKRLDWALEDPKSLSPELVRAIRDDIRQRVADLISAEGWR